ncbi:hypothetical protein ARMGADRAFT_589179 [Armillaria gallica]|uniref:Uncharacterized protein n=1 Tax=Armillaria gallica TaxID=47427 RepID=A0A2H3DU88_ARMGA|nr:hypothetical protein ARMGADRAFT_589179 [Armillaria gallica]
MQDHPEERERDPLIHTHLRLNANDDFFVLSPRPQLEGERLPPDVYAELLFIQPSLNYHQEIRNLVKAQLTNSTDESRRLQPIVRGNLLRKLQLLPEEDDLAQWLFQAIALSYWCIDSTPPLIMAPNGLQICSIPGTDHHAVSPWIDVDTYLYTYAVDEFPEPKDPWLRSLLKIAVSPSIQKAYGDIPSIDSLFGTVVRSIGHHTAADSFQLYGDVPSFNLDGDRYAVLKLAYTPVLSSELVGDTSVRSQDLRITLMIFVGYSIRHLLVLVSFLRTQHGRQNRFPG